MPVQVTVSVSSRNFRKAVDRNRIKRQMREVYRLQKSPLTRQLSDVKKQLALFFIYTGKEIPEYTDLLEKMNKILVRLQDIIIKSKVVD